MPPASASELRPDIRSLARLRKSSRRDLATAARAPYVAQFDAADANKTVDDWLSWENTNGETGPWSAAVSATIME